MAAKKFVVSGDQHRVIDVRMSEIKRQLGQKGGSPLDPAAVAGVLQKVINGGLGCGRRDFFPVKVPSALLVKVGDNGMASFPQDLLSAEVEMGIFFSDFSSDGFRRATEKELKLFDEQYPQTKEGFNYLVAPDSSSYSSGHGLYDNETHSHQAFLGPVCEGAEKRFVSSREAADRDISDFKGDRIGYLFVAL